MTTIPKSIIEEVHKIQENFLWNKKNPEIKHSTLIGEYEWGGLKEKVDVDTTLRSIRISWLRRLFDNNYHPWKIIPLKMIEQYDKSLILHSNFSFSRGHQFCRMPSFYLEILQIWSEAASQTPTSVEQILSQ